MIFFKLQLTAIPDTMAGLLIYVLLGDDDTSIPITLDPSAIVNDIYSELPAPKRNFSWIIYHHEKKLDDDSPLADTGICSESTVLARLKSWYEFKDKFELIHAILTCDFEKYGTPNHWNVSKITDMTNVFRNNHNFNYPIDNWDVSNVTDMKFMFNNASVFNQPLSNWDVSNVTNMTCMFSGTKSFNQSLDMWNVSKLRHKKGMFSCTSVEYPVWYTE